MTKKRWDRHGRNERAIVTLPHTPGIEDIYGKRDPGNCHFKEKAFPRFSHLQDRSKKANTNIAEFNFNQSKRKLKELSSGEKILQQNA